jgi:hypothetical protein
MLGGVDSEPESPPRRRREIDTRLDAVRARLRKLRETGADADRGRAASRSERLEAAMRHAVAAQAFAAQVLASNVEAFRRAAAAHEDAARVHDTAAAAGIGDVLAHERQATSHRMAAAADRQRAERAQSLISESEQAGPAAVSDEPRNGVAS